MRENIVSELSTSTRVQTKWKIKRSVVSTHKNEVLSAHKKNEVLGAHKKYVLCPYALTTFVLMLKLEVRFL